HLRADGREVQPVAAAAAVDVIRDAAAGLEGEDVGAAAPGEVLDVREGAEQDRRDRAAIGPGDGEGPPGVVPDDGVGAAAAVDVARQAAAGEREGVRLVAAGQVLGVAEADAAGAVDVAGVYAGDVPGAGLAEEPHGGGAA